MGRIGERIFTLLSGSETTRLEGSSGREADELAMPTAASMLSRGWI